jgi:methyl-accepting chemotaxis protein
MVMKNVSQLARENVVVSTSGTAWQNHQRTSMSILQWRNWKVFSKINLLIIPAIVPILLVTWFTYKVQRNASIETSQHIIQLITEKSGSAHEAYLEKHYDEFRRWTAGAKSYGTSIENGTLAETRKTFQQMKASTHDFTLLLLADKKGKALIAIGDTAEATTNLEGTTVPEASRLAPSGHLAFSLETSHVLQMIGADFSRTYIFSAPCYDSSGDPNGVFLAYMDWTAFQKQVFDTAHVLQENGFPDACAMMVDASESKSLIDSDKANGQDSWTASKSLQTFFNNIENENTTQPFKWDGQINYVSYASLSSGEKLNEKTGRSTADATSLRLAVFVPFSNVLAEPRAMMWENIVIAVIGSIVLFVAFRIVSNTICKPLTRTVKWLELIGDGDLTIRLEENGNDELANLARGCNAFAEKMRGIIVDIQTNSVSLESSATQLSSTAHQLKEGATRTTSQSVTAASAAEEMSVNMNQMASATRQMTDNINAVASSVEQLTTNIGEIAENATQASNVAGKASNLADASNTTISELGLAAHEIGKVIGVIQDIAEQTNLLALNATIEAARAGEAGKGFAVVATEVKELARQTADATEDIRQRIEAIQQSSGQAVHSIGEIGRVIEEINNLNRTIASAVEEQNATARNIASNISNTTQGAQRVATGVSETAIASDEITRNIAGVEQATKQTAEGAAHAETASVKMNDLAGALASLVTQFKVST